MWAWVREWLNSASAAATGCSGEAWRVLERLTDALVETLPAASRELGREVYGAARARWEWGWKARAGRDTAERTGDGGWRARAEGGDGLSADVGSAAGGRSAQGVLAPGGGEGEGPGVARWSGDRAPV